MARFNTAYPLIRQRLQEANLLALVEVFESMSSDVLARFEAGAATLLATRWDAVLGEVVASRNRATANEIGGRLAAEMGFTDFDPDVMGAWLDENARIVSEDINAQTRTKLEAAEDVDEVRHQLDILSTSSAAMYATSMVTAIAGFATRDVAEKAGAPAKMWETNSGNPRSAHRRMNGETVAIGERFSNGLLWPGDYRGSAADNANCQCSMVILM